MMNVVLDLETVPDPNVPWDPKEPQSLLTRPPERWKPELVLTKARPFAPTVCHKIVTIGFAAFDGYCCTHLKVVDGDLLNDEETAVRSFLSFLNENHPTIITWNGRGFDMPVLQARALKYGIQMPWWFNACDTRYRYSNTGHFDVKDHMSDFGATQAWSQDQMCKLLGMPGKPKSSSGTMDGSKVEELVTVGRLAEVNAYCLTDVLQLSVIWMRYQLLRGAIDLKSYQSAFYALRAQTEFMKGSLPENFMTGFDWRKIALEDK